MARVRKEIQVAEEAEQPTDIVGMLAWIQQLIDAVPEKAWEDAPTDASINHDHYLYGAPKQQL